MLGALETPTLTVYHPVVFQIAEHHHLIAVGNLRHIRRGLDRTVEDGIRKAQLHGLVGINTIQLDYPPCFYQSLLNHDRS